MVPPSSQVLLCPAPLPWDISGVALDITILCEYDLGMVDQPPRWSMKSPPGVLHEALGAQSACGSRAAGKCRRHCGPESLPGRMGNPRSTKALVCRAMG